MSSSSSSSASTKRRSSSSSSASSSSSSSSSSNDALSGALAFLKVDPNSIKNKQKRNEVYHRLKHEKQKLKSKLRKKRKKEATELGEEVPATKQQKTLDNMREADETVVEEGDDEVAADEADDEFASFFSNETTPRIVITTCYRPTKQMYSFIDELLHIFPNSFFFERKNFEVKEIAKQAGEEGYTDILIVKEDRKELTSLTHIHLGEGPTAHYKLSSVLLSKDIAGHAQPTSHRPELILNNFSTRLGQRIGRMFSCLFHQSPSFEGRRAVTFHNQRDFIFFRHHRYIFDSKDKVRLQEIGPRFTLKLEWLQSGIFDPEQGEYEYIQKTSAESGTRRKFFL